MYRMIGGDGQEYGPVDEDQMRQWILEGRADGTTRVKLEGEESWYSLGELETFQDLLGPVSRAAVERPQTSFASRGGGVDLESCFRRSWTLMKDHAPLLIGCSLLFFILFLGVSELLGYFTDPAIQRMLQGNILMADLGLLAISSVLSGTVSPLLYAGLYRVWLCCIRGEPVTAGDVFVGFTYPAAPLALSGLLVTILTSIATLALILPGIYLSVAWAFTTPLIVEKRIGVWAAMETSRQVVTRNWWMIFLLLILLGVLSALGFLLCCVGILVTFPIAFGALVFAYGDLFQTTDFESR